MSEEHDSKARALLDQFRSNYPAIKTAWDKIVSETLFTGLTDRGHFPPPTGRHPRTIEYLPYPVPPLVKPLVENQVQSLNVGTDYSRLEARVNLWAADTPRDRRIALLQMSKDPRQRKRGNRLNNKRFSSRWEFYR